MNQQAYLERRTFISLNGLRAIAVLAVIWQHTGTGDGLLGVGYYGVDLFFGISGFLITTLLLREHDRRGRVDLRAFYIRRSLRIFPLYYATLALYVVLTAATQLHTTKGIEFWHNLPAFATYTSNWFVPSDGDGTTFYFAWSLATEEQYYLVWAPLLALGLLYARPWLAAAGLALVGVVDVGLTLAGGSSFLHDVATSFASPIVVGSVIAMLLHYRFELVRPILAPRFVQLMLFIIIIFMLAAGWNQMLIGALMAVLVASVCVNEVRWLAWRPLAYVGTVSYGVYLLHMLCSNVARPVVGGKGPALFVTTTVLAVIVASVSWRWFESPILRYKRRFERTTKGDSATMRVMHDSRTVAPA